MKCSFLLKVIYLVPILLSFNIKNLFTIESAALNMGLAECIGVYKQLKVINILDSESSNILIALETKIKNIKINNDSYKISDILLGCKNLKSHLR